MPLYDPVKDLTLAIERVELEPHALPLKHHDPAHDRHPPARRRPRGRRRGRQLRGGAAARVHRRRAPAAGRRAHARLVLGARRRPARLPAAGGSSRPRSTWPFARRASSLADAVGREPQPVRFVVSQSAVKELLALYPELRFKLDASDKWTDEVVAELAATGAVDVVDLKGLYDGEWVDATPSAELYGRVARAFPDAWLEDARLTDETRPVLEPHRDRLTWDFPIHSVADVDALEWEPRCLNSKPSRFGSVRNLFDFYDACAERGIAVYGGGQFELGPGRGQIQHLASLFHAGRAQRRRAEGVQRGRPAAGAAAEPAAACVARPRLPLSVRARRAACRSRRARATAAWRCRGRRARATPSRPWLRRGPRRC